MLYHFNFFVIFWSISCKIVSDFQKYFLCFNNSILEQLQYKTFEGKKCLVSGSGNVAQYTCEKINELGGKVVTLSDSSGWIFDGDGITADKLAWVMDLKNNRRGRISEYVSQFTGAEFNKRDELLDHNPMWAVDADCAFPSATQNEINATDASTIANSFYNISKKELSRLCSFSLSYNTQIGNAGIMSLVKALPLSIHEIGFVDCGFGYQGAQALLGMIKKSPLLHTLCIEGNHIPKNVRNKFLELNQENPHLSIYI